MLSGLDSMESMFSRRKKEQKYDKNGKSFGKSVLLLATILYYYRFSFSKVKEFVRAVECWEPFHSISITIIECETDWLSFDWWWFCDFWIQKCWTRFNSFIYSVVNIIYFVSSLSVIETFRCFRSQFRSYTPGRMLNGSQWDACNF